MSVGEDRVRTKFNPSASGPVQAEDGGTDRHVREQPQHVGREGGDSMIHRIKRAIAALRRRRPATATPGTPGVTRAKNMRIDTMMCDCGCGQPRADIVLLNDKGEPFAVASVDAQEAVAITMALCRALGGAARILQVGAAPDNASARLH